jgi:serine phosphatase RsbU (regulator of sigma subunit)
MRKLLNILLLIFSALQINAQDRKDIDSLYKLLPTLSETDTQMVRVLNSLAWDISYHDLDSGLALINRSLELAREIGDAQGEANAQNVAGTIYADLGRYPEAIHAHLQSIRIKDSLESDASELGGSYHNLALVYESMDSLELSLKYQRMAYAYYKRGDNSSGIAPIANVLGRHCIDVDSISLAKEYFEEGRQVAIEYNLKHWIAANMAGTAYCLAKEGNFEEADTLIKEAFVIARSEDNPYDMMAVWIMLSNLRELQKNYTAAISAMDSALSISTQLNVRDSRMNQLRRLAELYEASGDKKLSLKFYISYQLLKDSILSTKNQQNIKNLETVYEKDKTEKALAIAREDDQQQKIYVAGGIVSSVGFIVIAILLFGRIKMGKKVGLVLEQQKAIIESKNKDITDSINYARRIQEAVTPVEVQLRNIFPKGFIYNRPRSIVSGDFWWIAETDSDYFLALGDCSGHGVPGGFMSVMAASFLNGIVIENKVHAPEEILYELNKKVRAALQHEGTEENTPLVSDTIEIAMCRFNKQKTEMNFSSAGMPVILVRKKQVIEYRGAEQRAGSVRGSANPFTRNTIELQPSDKLFLFSDGLTSLPGSDQRHVYDLLATLQSHQEIDSYVSEHSGKFEQPDDILILGAEI